MKKNKKELGVDADGVEKVMHKGDYLADFSGQLAQALTVNIVGQLTYFYTDKVQLAVAGVGVVLLVAKILDAVLGPFIGNLIDHSKGGNHKYYSWMARLALPAAILMIALFTVPGGIGEVGALAYALVTNVLLTGVIYNFMSVPFAAVMVVRTKSQSERSTMGVIRGAASYVGGMILSILTIPLTNLLGGNQSAWIKYGAVLGLVILLTSLICWNNGHKAHFVGDVEGHPELTKDDNEGVPFFKGLGMLFHNKYWVIVLLFSLITNITNAITASGGTYYAKWIFGNDNLVGVVGGVGLIATLIGFILSKPIITKLGVRNTILMGLLGYALVTAIRCIAPTNFIMYIVTNLAASFLQIPLMSLYGVLMAMVVDYNEYLYDKKLVGVSSSVIGFGATVGGGLGVILLSGILSLGHYDASLQVATTSMRWSIYGFSNFLPIIMNVVMFLIFLKFDLEKKLPAMRKEVEQRHAAKADQGDK